MTVKEWYESIGLDWDKSLHIINVYVSGSQGVCSVDLCYDVEADDSFKHIVDCAINDIEDSIREDADDYIQDVSDYYDKDALEEALEDGDIDEDEFYMILDAFAEAECDSGEWTIWVQGTEERYDLRELMEV